MGRSTEIVRGQNVLKFLGFCLLGVCLGTLTACDSLPKQIDQYTYQLIDKWKKFEFREFKRPPQRRFFGGSDQHKMLPAAIGVTIVLVLLAYFYSKYWERQAVRKKAIKKALVKLEKLYDQLQITEDDETLLGKIAHSFEPPDILKVVESSEEFEARVEDLKREQPDEKFLLQVYALRQRLGFGFYNKRIPFLCTQMLPPSGKMECVLELPNRSVMFMSSIISATEKYIMIKPPTVKGQPANLKRYSHLTCKVYRNDDAHYQFTVPILRQMTGKVNALILGQTHEIEQHLLRHAERVKVDLPALFYTISEKNMFLYTDRSKSPTLLKDLPRFEGRIVDLSAGGAQVVVKELPLQFPDDALLLFPLKRANIQGDLTARILKVEPHEESQHLHLEFFRLREMKRMRLNRFIEKTKND